MKDLYIKPEVQFNKFDILDVITGSDGPGDPTEANNDDDWSGFYEKSGRAAKLY